MLDQAEANNLNVVLNVDHSDELDKDPDRRLPRFVALWEQIARRYEDRKLSGLKWEGTEAELNSIRKSLDQAAEWGKNNNRPIFLGEFGAFEKADLDSRARWTAGVAREAESRGFSWAYWEFGAGFGAYDRREKAWQEPLLRALVPK